MQTMLKNDLNALLAARQAGPFISIYLETNPIINDLSQQKLAFRRSLKTAETQFAQHFPHEDWLVIQEQLQPLLNDNDFWLSQTNRWIGIITNSDQLFTFDLNTAVKHQVNVATMPAILPLVQDNQQNFNYDLLCLNEDSLELYSKRGSDFSKIDLTGDAPTTLQKALGTEVRGGNLNFHAGPTGGTNHSVSYHGHNAKSEERTIDQKNYYQAIDQYLLNKVSRVTSQPLIVCALPQNQAVFRQISKNPYLLKHLKIEKSPVGLSKAEIGTLAEPLQKQWQQELITVLLEHYESAQSRKLTIDEPFMMVTPALSGRIQTLLIADNARVNGTITENGATVTTSNNTPDNLADDLADLVLEMGGQVRILPAAQFPTDSGLVALLRY